jgi:hypothetical protein
MLPDRIIRLKRGYQPVDTLKHWAMVFDLMEPETGKFKPNGSPAYKPLRLVDLHA